MKKYILLCIVSYCVCLHAAAQTLADESALGKETICYTLLSDSKEYGKYMHDSILVDSVTRKSTTFYVTCDFTKILEVASSFSWKTFYILSSDEHNDDTYSYSTLGTDGVKYMFVLDTKHYMFTKFYTNKLGEVFTEFHPIYEGVEQE